MDYCGVVSVRTHTNLSGMTKDQILHSPPWNKRTRILYKRLRKKIHRLLSDTRQYRDNFKFKRKDVQRTL